MTTGPFRVQVCPGERAWKRARLGGVGASEAAAIVRLSKWASEYSLYWRKQEARIDDQDGDALMGEMAEWGHRHEPSLAAWFADNCDDPVQDVWNPGDYAIFWSTERPHMFATLDRLVTIADQQVPLELKCAWYAAAKEWDERIPIAYRVQLQQQLYVTGADFGYFAVLRNGCSARWYRDERHDKFIARLCDRVDAFWDRVQRNDPPEPDGSKASLARLFEQFPQARPQVVDLPSELAEAGAAYDAACEAAKAADRTKDEIKARVQVLMQESSHGRLPDDSGFAWTQTKKGRQFRRVENIKHDF
jgi:putative phage-type endonuclease